MNVVKIPVLLCFLTLISFTQSVRILMLFTCPGRSHYFLGSALARGLVEKGHDVTMVSAFGEKNPPKNGTYKDIVIDGLYEKLQERFAQHGNLFDIGQMHPAIMITSMLSMPPSITETVLKSENMQNLLKSDEKFDVIIMEQFLNDAEKVIAAHFGAPLILFTSVGPTFWVNPLVGNPSPSSYVPHVVLPYFSDMTFTERLTNTLINAYSCLLHYLIFYPNQNKLIKTYHPNGPDLHDMLYNVSLVLLNSHSSFNQPVPLVPNMVEIGGFHVKPPNKLPQDLQEFLDNAKDGVIYFSMGSNLKSAQLPVEKRDAILKTLSKLKEKVLWKWEEDVLPGQPPNVKLSKWLPQQGILAHPNVKLFITHGGMLSTIETIYHGVPVLSIPIFGDQKLNAKRGDHLGYGLTLDYSEVSEKSFTNKIRELLDNPKYRNNAKHRSKLFHDRQVSPMDTAVYWVEYIARHKGAPHLRVAGVDLPWYKYYLVDVISVIALFLLILFITSYKVIKCILRRFCTKQKPKVKRN